MKRLRKIRRGCRAVGILSILVIVLLCLLVIFLLVRKRAAAAIGHVSWDVMLLLDASNSMASPDGQGSDPEGLSAEAASLIITMLGLDAQQYGHRLGVIYFGTESQLTSPLVSIRTPADRETLRSVLGVTEPLGWTDPLQALALAYEHLYLEEVPRIPELRDDDLLSSMRRQAVILITDGKPELPTLTTPSEKAAYVAELRALVAQFQAQNCAIFTVAISADAAMPNEEMPTVYRNLWQEMAASTPPAVYYEVRAADDLPQVYHSIALQLLGNAPHPPEIAGTIEGTSVNKLRVEPGLRRVTFTLFKREPRVQVEIRRPGGTLVHHDDPDARHLGGGETSHDEMWVIEQPREGTWTVTFRGTGHVMLWKDGLLTPDLRAPAFTLNVQVPPNVVETAPLVCAVTVNGERDALLNAADVQVTAELRRAGFGEVLLALHLDEDGVYRVTRNDLPPGTYTILVRALLDGQEIARHEKAFSIVSIPHLAITAPRSGVTLSGDQPLTVTARVSTGSVWLDATALEALGTLTATLVGPLGFSQAIPMLTRADRTFAAHAHIPASAGRYTLTLRLAGTTSEGVTFSQAHAVVLNVDVAAPTQAQAVWPVWLVVGGSCAGLAGLWMYQRQPLLEGQWRVVHAPEKQRTGSVIPVPAARGAVRLGGKKAAGSRTIGLAGVHAPFAQMKSVRDNKGVIDVWLAPLAGAVTELQCNGRPLTISHRLQDGDIIDAMGYRLRYENVRQAAARRQRTNQPSEKPEPARRWSM